MYIGGEIRRELGSENALKGSDKDPVWDLRGPSDWIALSVHQSPTIGATSAGLRRVVRSKSTDSLFRYFQENFHKMKASWHRGMMAANQPQRL